MTLYNEKFPDPEKIEKELSEFLAKKFGGNVKLASPIAMSQAEESDTVEQPIGQPEPINFDLKPEELIAYLDQYIIKQDSAKDIIGTKICTHFNRIRHQQSAGDDIGNMTGSIKNNILMLGPTGVGKTYIIRLIANKIGVPFVKGDATKFSETGYVGGDVEDLVRDLVREADGDIDRAQYGIIYIDEIDKIASSHNLVGADVSRTGVQRALLKPMEETEVDLKVPHDPISMLQEIERYRKTGRRDSSSINTKNILFIMSGAFTGLDKIIQKRLTAKTIGFSASPGNKSDAENLLGQVKSEDLISYGFETEFVGRLPVRAVFERLNQEDLFAILTNPNNPIISGKKLDFAAYGIDIKFDLAALHLMAERAFAENTGARGLISAVEEALIQYEKRLPSTKVDTFGVTEGALKDPAHWIDTLARTPDEPVNMSAFERVARQERDNVSQYIEINKNRLGEKSGLPLTPARIALMAHYYSTHIVDLEKVFAKFTSLYEKIKTIEMQFLKNNGLNIVLEEEAIDYITGRWLKHPVDVDAIYKQLTKDFVHGLRLVNEKTGRSRFFITRQGLDEPEAYIKELLRDESVTPSKDGNPDNDAGTLERTPN